MKLEDIKDQIDTGIENLFSSIENSDSTYLKKVSFKIEREEHYCKKLHEMSPEKRKEIILKIKAKYNSDEYNDKERSKGRQPICYLYNILFRYATLYGIACQYKPNGFFHENQFVIDDNIIIKQINGQGTLTYIEEVDKDEIIPHLIYDNVVEIYNPKGECIGTTCNVMSFNDVRIQAYFKNSGHYFKWKGKKYSFVEKKAAELYNLLLDQQIMILKGKQESSETIKELYKNFLEKAQKVALEEYGK